MIETLAYTIDRVTNIPRIPIMIKPEFQRVGTKVKSKQLESSLKDCACSSNSSRAVLEHTPKTENDKRKGNKCNTEQLGTINRQNVLDPTATERCQLMASGTNKSSKAKSLSRKENNGQESAKKG
jgi:hypothetical protein